MGLIKKMSYVVKGLTPFGAMQYGFVGLMLSIDSLIYWLGTILYSLFVGLSQVTILTTEAYQNIADRIYILVGIVGLFIMTFTLLKAMVDPDKAGQAVVKSFKSLIISVGLVILLPTIFRYAFSFQNAIIKDGVIHNLFNFRIDGKSTGEDEKTMDEICSTEGQTYVVYDENGEEIREETVENPDNKRAVRAISESKCQGNYVLANLFFAFFIPRDEGADPESIWGTKLSAAKEYVARTGNFIYMTSFVQNASDVLDIGGGGILYIFLISTAAGAFAAYVILSFCIDLGVRSFKLAFYQIIAPIPIFLRIIPGKESYFNKWVSATTKCFLEIFVRILLIEFMIFMCKNFLPILSTAFSGMGEVNLLGKAVLILGLFTFIKQAPKLFKEALGIEGTGVQLGIKGKLEEGTAIPRQAAAVVGSAALAGTQAVTHGISDMKANGGVSGKGIAKTAGSALTSSLNGIRYGIGSATKDGGPKSMKELGEAITGNADKISTARSEREAYQAAHPGMKDKASAFATKAKRLAGIDAPGLSAKEQRRYDILSEYTKRIGDMEALWKDEKAYKDAEAASRNAFANARNASSGMRDQIASYNAEGATSAQKDFYKKVQAEMQKDGNQNYAQALSKVADNMMQEYRQGNANGTVSAAQMAEMANIQSDIANIMNSAENTAYQAAYKDAESAKKTLESVTSQIQVEKSDAIKTKQAALKAFVEEYEGADFMIAKTDDNGNTILNSDGKPEMVSIFSSKDNEALGIALSDKKAAKAELGKLDIAKAREQIKNDKK